MSKQPLVSAVDIVHGGQPPRVTILSCSHPPRSKMLREEGLSIAPRHATSPASDTLVMRPTTKIITKRLIRLRPCLTPPPGNNVKKGCGPVQARSSRMHGGAGSHAAEPL
eukprot:9939072-Alexandrium_andersonii.AAC.1